MKNLAALVIACVLFFPSLNANARSMAGIELPEALSVAQSSKPLRLNGAGLRKKFFLKIYLAALYLPQPSNDVVTLLNQPPANRVLMHFLYSEVSKEKMDAAWEEGFSANMGPADYQAMEPRLKRFMAMFGDLREGDRVWLDFDPGSGTRVSINGVELGAIEGADFNAALLSVWLGENPVASELKKALLGADND